MKRWSETEDRIVRLREVVRITGLSRATIYRIANETDQFPPPLMLGEKAVGWWLSEVYDWISRRPRIALGTTKRGPGRS